VLFDGMKECCDVLYHNYVDLASIYRILPQIRAGSRYIGSIQIRIHQIHQISGRIRIWIRCILRHKLLFLYVVQEIISVLLRSNDTAGFPAKTRRLMGIFTPRNILSLTLYTPAVRSRMGHTLKTDSVNRLVQ